VFDAYVNIGSLAGQARALRERYPQAKFIATAGKTEIPDDNNLKIIDDLNGTNVTVLHLDATNKWQVICEHLRCSPPVCSFPELADLGQRQLFCGDEAPSGETPNRDKSPWVVEPRQWWQGIRSAPMEGPCAIAATPVRVSDDFEFLDTRHWLSRDDTFTDNLALFRLLKC
jgi:hypothetical protein